MKLTPEQIEVAVEEMYAKYVEQGMQRSGMRAARLVAIRGMVPAGESFTLEQIDAAILKKWDGSEELEEWLKLLHDELSPPKLKTKTKQAHEELYVPAVEKYHGEYGRKQ